MQNSQRAYTPFLYRQAIVVLLHTNASHPQTEKPEYSLMVNFKSFDALRHLLKPCVQASENLDGTTLIC